MVDQPRGDEVPGSAARRGRAILWWGLGVLWLADGLLQLQPAMFTPQFVQQVLQPAAQGQPAWLAALLGLGAAAWHGHPALANAAAALVQLAIGLVLLFGRERVWGRLGLWLSLGWGLVVWVFGEGLGGLLTGSASALTGAPGSALCYVLAATLLLLPARSWAPAGIGRWALRMLGLLWLLLAALQAWPASGFWTGHALSDLFGSVAALPQPAALAAPTRALAAVAPSLLNGLFVAVLVVLGWTYVQGTPRGWAYGLTGAWLLFIWWSGQGFGGLFTGTATDPNSALPLGVLVLALATAAVPRDHQPLPGAGPAEPAWRRPLLPGGRRLGGRPAATRAGRAWGMPQSLVGTVVPAWYWSAGAFVLVLAASFAPLVGAVLLAPPVALLAGGAAAYWSTRGARSTPGRTVALGAGAGLGALLAGVAAFTSFGFGLGNDPAAQAFIRADASHPAAHPPEAWAVALGAVIGLGAGVINLAYASLGGLLVGLHEVRAATRSRRELAR